MPFTGSPSTSGKKITLYGAGSDYCTRMVLAGLKEMEVGYIFYDVEGKPRFLDKYPFAKLPVVKDGNRLLFEARDIIKHYAEERRRRPTEDVEEWLRVEEQEFYPHANALVCQLVSAKWLGVQQDEGVIRNIVRKLEKVLDNKYEPRLSNNRFLAGTFYSVADLIHLPLIHYIYNYTDKKQLIDGRRYVKTWWETISAKPNWQNALKERGIQRR